MKTKSEITQEYISMIDDTQSKLETYEDVLKQKKNSIPELCYGNRKIEEIEDEIDEMLLIITNMLNECTCTKQAIRSNENNF